MKDDSKETGLRLLKKGRQGILRMIFSRFGLILVLLAVQVLFLFSIFHWFEEFLPHIYGGVVIFTVFMVLYLLNSSMGSYGQDHLAGSCYASAGVWRAFVSLYAEERRAQSFKESLCTVE